MNIGIIIGRIGGVDGVALDRAAGQERGQTEAEKGRLHGEGSCRWRATGSPERGRPAPSFRGRGQRS